MRRILFLPVILLLFCWLIATIEPLPAHEAGATGTVTLTTTVPFSSQTLFPSSTPQASSTRSLPTESPVLTPALPVPPQTSPTDKPQITPTAVPDATAAPARVRLHPDGGLYVGDQVSFEVILLDPEEDRARYESVQVALPDGTVLASQSFGGYGLGGRYQATLIWAWDTSGYAAGDYALTFTLAPQQDAWTETITLLPQEQIPFPGESARWETARSLCCTLHYVTGTAAERDLSSLLQQADEQARDAVKRMGVEFTEPITITMLPRVLGHGGFASSEISISYLDRNYAGTNFELVLHHEMIHILDGRLGGGYRPSLFVEGLAVYQSDGHFKPEPLMPRAAALLSGETGLGWYIPLADLADNFYLSQHEIGYLEGGALIQYMVNTWGWEAFSRFYRDISSPEDDKPSTAIDVALKEHFNLSFASLEARFIDALQRIQVTTELRNDMRSTVEFYDTVRRYQVLLDPSAFFQTAWLLDTASMRQRGILADYLRHPNAPENLALEAMLGMAYDALRLGYYAILSQQIAAINAVLTALERGNAQAFSLNDLAEDTLAIVRVVGQAGYELQRLDLQDDRAQALATLDSSWLKEIYLRRDELGWKIAENEYAAAQCVTAYSFSIRDPMLKLTSRAGVIPE